MKDYKLYLTILLLAVFYVFLYNSTKNLFTTASKGYESLRLGQEKQLKYIKSLKISGNTLKLEKRLPEGKTTTYVIQKPKDAEIIFEDEELRIRRFSAPKVLELDATFSERLNFGLGLRLLSFDFYSLGFGVSHRNLYVKIQRFVFPNTKICITYGPEYDSFNFKFGFGLSIDL